MGLVCSARSDKSAAGWPDHEVLSLQLGLLSGNLTGVFAGGGPARGAHG